MCDQTVTKTTLCIQLMVFGQKDACRNGVSTDTYPIVKGILLTTLCLALAACDSKPAADPLQAEREKLEAERADLAAEKERLASEAELASRKAAAEAEAKRLADEREKLEAEKQRLAEGQAKLEADRAAAAATTPPASTVETATLAEASAGIDVQTARVMDEKSRIEALKLQAQADRLAEQRAAAETKAREAAAKRAEEEAAIEQSTAVFFEALGDHGDWFQTDRHGFAWRPKRAVIDPEWRPYTDGRWQWTEYGWTWQSLEPYGWAVYHYGRWFRHPNVGWLWSPGHEWAPAWVSWRVKGSEFIGWAPLPPEGKTAPRAYGTTVDRDLEVPPGNYVFLPTRDFDEPTYVHKFVERPRQMEMLRGSRNVTRLEELATTEGKTRVAGGPDPGTISSVIREQRQNPDLQPVPQLNLVLAGNPESGHKGDTVEGGSMLLFAPKLGPVNHNRKPKETKETLRVAQRDHGWTETSPEHEAEWRALVERESDAVQNGAVARNGVAASQRMRIPPMPRVAPKPRAPVIAIPLKGQGTTSSGSGSSSGAARPGALGTSNLQPAAGF